MSVDTEDCILLCDSGPALLRGPVAVKDADGVEHYSNRPVVAVCRCNASSLRPWCDGSHKVVRRVSTTESK